MSDLAWKACAKAAASLANGGGLKPDDCLVVAQAAKAFAEAAKVLQDVEGYGS